MKNALSFLMTIALAAVFALPAFAQDATTQENEARAALYQKFLDNYKGQPEQQKVAYQTGKEYVGKYSGLTDPSDVQIVDFVRKWVSKYEKADRDFRFWAAIEKGDFAAAAPLGRQMLGEEPDNVRINLVLGRTGYVAVSKGDKNASNDALGFIRRTMQLVEAGKTTDNWAPFLNKDDTLGWLNYMEGFLLLDAQPDAAVKSLIKAAQSNGAASKEPTTYDTLAYLYTKEYQKAATEYQKKFPDGTEITPELKPEYDRLQWQLDKIKDRIIDAYARSVASSMKPEHQTAKAKAMTQLTAIYKSRNNDSDAGLKELIAGVMAKPLMLPGQEPTPAPAPAPTTTTTSTATTTGGSPQTSQAGMATPSTGAAKPGPGAKPSATPASTTPRP